MKYHVVKFPRPGVRAVAAENTDGSFTFYVSAHLSEEAREKAVEELAMKLYCSAVGDKNGSLGG